jgi:hypothetical protein
MTIEFTNAVAPKAHSAIPVAIIVVSSIFFFIPTTLIILGYLSSQPTGSLISPLPQGVVSQASPTPAPSPATTSAEPIIAGPNESTAAAQTSVVPESESNITDKTATMSAGLIEVGVDDPEIKATSLIYLSPRPEDKSIYAVKSKEEGRMVISANMASDIVRYIDYHIVNP